VSSYNHNIDTTVVFFYTELVNRNLVNYILSGSHFYWLSMESPPTGVIYASPARIQEDLLRCLAFLVTFKKYATQFNTKMSFKSADHPSSESLSLMSEETCQYVSDCNKKSSLKIQRFV